MKRYLFILLALLSARVFAQSGSFILSKYTANTYWNDSLFPTPANGKLYAYPLADTGGNTWTNQLLSVFKFSPSDYDGHCFDSIQMHGSFVADTPINNTFNYYFGLNPLSGYRQTNPMRRYAFSLHGKTDTAYTTFTPKTGPGSGSDTEICFFIIPGSGDNQTTAIVRNEGYHVMNCNVMNTLRKHGDVYVFVKPNEDARAIRVQPLPLKKMVTDIFPTDSYLNQFLISNYRHEGINYLIECVAAIRELKRKYKKVFLLGCSQGGYATLYAALEAEPDGALIASGYSVNLDDNYLQFGNVAQKFAQLPFLLKKDSVKQRIAEQKTSYYFAWPTNDSPIYQAENQNHYTENYFSSANPLSNVQYLYTYANHAFPPCPFIDSFVRQVKFKSKAFFLDTLNACLYDSMVRQVQFIGQPPFSCNLYRDNILVGTFTNLPANAQCTFYQEGHYQLRDIVDANGNSGIWSDLIPYKKYPKAGLQIQSATFDCDSAFTMVQCAFTGTPPYHLDTYRKDSSGVFQWLHSAAYSGNTAIITLGNGEYRFDLQDATACEVLQDSLVVNEYPLQYSFLGEQYDCTQHKAAFSFALQGKAPYTLTFLKNGTVYTVQEWSDTVTWLLDNGYYVLIEVADSNNCAISINQAISIQYDSLSVSSTPPLYACERNESSIDFHLDGNAPFVLHYLYNNMPLATTLGNDTTLYYPNGDWQLIDVVDQTGCVSVFNTPVYQFNFDTFRVVMAQPVFACDSNKTLVHFDFSGNAPFSVDYLANGNPQQFTTNGTPADWYLSNGQYLFQQITDGMGCHLDTNQAYTFNYTPLAATVTQQEFDCDSNKYRVTFALTGNMPWQIHYHNATGNYTTSTLQSAPALWFDNGNWVLDSVTDATACQVALSMPLNISYSAIQAAISYQAYNCDSDRHEVVLALNGNAPWIVSYVKAGPIPVIFLDTTYNPLPHYYLPQGTWTFQQVSDVTGCVANLSATVVNNAQPLTYQQTLQQYDCDSNQLKLSYSFTGDGPWQFIYRNNQTGILDTLQSVSPGLTFYLSNGEYTLLETRDTKCSFVLNDTLEVQFTPLQSLLGPAEIDCDSGMYAVELISQGGLLPYRYAYTYNSINDTLLSYQDTSRLYLPNGAYFFHRVLDSLQCTVPYNQSYTAEYHPFEFDSLTSRYLCAKDSTRIDFYIPHQHPLHLQYSKNGITDSLLIDQNLQFLVGNGTYQWIALIDSLGCRQDIQKTMVIDNHPIRLDTVYTETDCANRIHQYHFNLQGQSPWTLSYNYQHVPDTAQFNSAATTWPVSPGVYYLAELSDSTGCRLPIGRQDSLSPFLAGGASLQWNNNELIALPDGYRYAWYYNQQLIDSTQSNRLSTRGAGKYQVAVLDPAGCQYLSNTLDNQYTTLVEAYPVPLSNILNVLINEPFGRYWDYMLTDMTGKKLLAGTVTRPYLALALEHLQAGVYHLLVVFENDPQQHVLRLIKY